MTRKHATPPSMPDQAPDPSGSLWALVPMKALDEAKTRLEPCLGGQRRGLALAMFEDVIRSLVSSRAFAGVAVVTADPKIGKTAKAMNAQVIDEVGRGMNKAIRQGVNDLIAKGARGVAIIPADVPLITGSEIRRVMADLEHGRADAAWNVVGILPSEDRDGTNFLSIEGMASFPFAYGPGSFGRHREAASLAGCTTVILDSKAFGLDIDDEADLRSLIDVCLSRTGFRQTRTWKFLCREGYADTGSELRRAINE